MRPAASEQACRTTDAGPAVGGFPKARSSRGQHPRQRVLRQSSTALAQEAPGCAAASGSLADPLLNAPWRVERTGARNRFVLRKLSSLGEYHPLASPLLPPSARDGTGHRIFSDQASTLCTGYLDQHASSSIICLAYSCSQSWTLHFAIYHRYSA